jgi:hypothetical protein
MKLETKAITLALFSLIIMGTLATITAAVNSPGTIAVDNSGRRAQSLNGQSVPAQAGNVSQLTIDDTRITAHWQGYYGTVQGTIKLDDAGNNTLFDWQLADPSGEVYASNSSSISWENITCVNMTGSSNTGSRSSINRSIIEPAFNITSSEMDGLDETFNYTFGGEFAVSWTTIDSSFNCPMAYMYVNNVSQQSKFKEIAMTDNTSVVFAALLEHNSQGYSARNFDFEMIVPTSSLVGTDYYMYVELS